MSFTSKMQAITMAKTGGIDVLEKTEVPFPEVGEDHVVIKVEYAGVNFADTYYRKGLYPTRQFPAIMGSEAAGTIIGLPSDQAVLSDEQYKQQDLKIGRKVAVYAPAAGHAEYISISWRNVSPLPSSVSTLTGAASLLQAITAVSFMDEAYNVQKGNYILVHTVAGGLGLIFAQYAKYKGATIIGTTSTAEKAALAKQYGADYVILYPTEDTVQKVLEITNGEGVHAIYDGVGKDTFDNNFKMIRRKGTVVSVGNASGAVPPFSPLKLVEKNIALLRPIASNYFFTAAEWTHYTKKVYRLIADGTIRIKIHAEYPFTTDGARQAQTDVTSGKTTGKLVIKIAA